MQKLKYITLSTKVTDYILFKQLMKLLFKYLYYVNNLNKSCLFDYHLQRTFK